MAEKDITRISVADFSVSIIGIVELMKEMAATYADKSDEEARVFMLDRLEKDNYIPKKAREDYGKAFVREFRKFLGQPYVEEAPRRLDVKVLGAGCSQCRQLTQTVMEVLTELDIPAAVDHVTDMREIARYGIMGSPALLINGKAVAVGSSPPRQRLKKWLLEASSTLGMVFLAFLTALLLTGFGLPDVRPASAGAVDGQSEGTERGRMIRLSNSEIEQNGVELSTASENDLEDALSFPGEVVLNEDSVMRITPRIPGVVREVAKRAGDKVKRGEVMAVIESLELAAAKAGCVADFERVELAQAKYAREESLWKKKGSNEREYLDAKQALAEARIALRLSEQKLYALGFSKEYAQKLPSEPENLLSRFEITAPFDATVIEKSISPGEMLKDDEEAFVVADLSSVWVNLNVSRKDIGRIRSGLQTIVDFGEKGLQCREECEGKVAFIDPVLKGDDQSTLVRVIVPNKDGKFRPGMLVTAKVLADDAQTVVTAPATALQTIGEQAVVFVRTEEGFEARPVKTGRSSESGVEILSGLKAGERYASKGTDMLKKRAGEQ